MVVTAADVMWGRNIKTTGIGTLVIKKSIILYCLLHINLGLNILFAHVMSRHVKQAGLSIS